MFVTLTPNSASFKVVSQIGGAEIVGGPEPGEVLIRPRVSQGQAGARNDFDGGEGIGRVFEGVECRPLAGGEIGVEASGCVAAVRYETGVDAVRESSDAPASGDGWFMGRDSVDEGFDHLVDDQSAVNE